MMARQRSGDSGVSGAGIVHHKGGIVTSPVGLAWGLPRDGIGPILADARPRKLRVTGIRGAVGTSPGLRAYYQQESRNLPSSALLEPEVMAAMDAAPRSGAATAGCGGELVLDLFRQQTLANLHRKQAAQLSGRCLALPGGLRHWC
ncbi:MAG: hypothetical protein IPP47_04230 [Bryobacterales bacterium]|nr:hypothetical protein [Bryobacterales bacterium]